VPGLLTLLTFARVEGVGPEASGLMSLAAWFFLLWTIIGLIALVSCICGWMSEQAEYRAQRNR
jgi:hypothetical protein